MGQRPIPLRFANAPLARGFPQLSSPAQPSEMFLFLIGSAEGSFDQDPMSITANLWKLVTNQSDSSDSCK